MSSCPGLTLEDFLLWNYNLTAEFAPEANFSTGIAQALGNIRPRHCLTQNQLRTLTEGFEHLRKEVENALLVFDDEGQSWRTYAGYAFDFIPDDIYTAGKIYIDALKEPH
jgi:hypothetical protein